MATCTSTGAMLYSAQSSSSGIARNQDHDVGPGSSPSRPISSPITPSSAVLTRHLHSLMPLDQPFSYNNNPFTNPNSINLTNSNVSSGPIGTSHSAIHSSVIHETTNNTVAKMLSNVHSGASDIHLNEHQPNDHNNTST